MALDEVYERVKYVDARSFGAMIMSSEGVNTLKRMRPELMKVMGFTDDVEVKDGMQFAMGALPPEGAKGNVGMKAKTLLRLFAQADTIDAIYELVVEKTAAGIPEGHKMHDVSVGVHGRVDFANAFADRIKAEPRMNVVGDIHTSGNQLILWAIYPWCTTMLGYWLDE